MKGEKAKVQSCRIFLFATILLTPAPPREYSQEFRINISTELEMLKKFPIKHPCFSI